MARTSLWPPPRSVTPCLRPVSPRCRPRCESVSLVSASGLTGGAQGHKIRHVHALLLCAARSAGPSLADRVSHAAGGREGRAGGVVGRPVLLPVARRPGEGRASSRPEDRKSVV